MRFSVAISIIFFLGISWKPISAQDFIDWTSIVLPQVECSSVAWGDYDNDGDLDILITGDDGDTARISKIYRNLGSETFEEQTGIILPGVNYSAVAWGDYDNDGYLDILLTGMTASNNISRIYKNTGSNNFEFQSDIILTGVYYGSVDWGDADNDGDLDILLTGHTGSEYVSKIYKNNGDNTFTEQTQVSLAAVNHGSVAWGDYDNDGDLDILLTGEYQTSEVYKNYGDFIFVEQTGITLWGLSNTAAAWGDYDSDGDLDILLAGDPGSAWSWDFSLLYENIGDNSFTEQTQASLTGTSNGSADWGDYDNDGDLDILLTGLERYGIYGTGRTAHISKNNGDNTFTDQTSISLTAVHQSSVAWGDYDNDGDLDILLTGNTSDDAFVYDPVTKIYKNMSSVSNTIPDVPSGLSSKIFFHPVTGNSKTDLSWNKASDNETPQDGLTYNIYFYQKDGDTLWSSMSDIQTGYRKIPALGNVQHDTTWSIYNLQPGEYCWSVQSIDNTFAGSLFAQEDTFLIAITPPEASGQKSCSAQTVPNLEASGENIKWYSDEDLLSEVYSGSPFATGNTDPGIYTYYVTQTINEYESPAAEVSLTIYESPVAMITDSTNILCAGQAVGTATITPSGGTEPYMYHWDDDPVTTDSTVTGLLGDRYYHVVVMDSNQCTSTDSVMLSEPDTLVAEITNWTNISDIGESDGTATVEPAGGIPPYTYLWDDLSNTTDSTVTGLSPNQWYHVIVTDSNGCTAMDSLILTEPGTLRVEITDSTNISCHGLSDGTATVTVWEGTEPFAFLWDDELGTATASVENLAPNRWYHVTVTDGSMQSVTDSIMLIEPDSIRISKEFSEIICYGTDDGYINLGVSGGTAPYTYQWNNGADGAAVSDLGPGMYNVVLTDSNGCHVEDSTMIDSVTPGQGAEICMVTVWNDNETWRNLIVWEKYQDIGIEYYNVYRIQAIDTVLLASVHHDSISVLLDISSEPEFQSYIYLLSTTDICGNESGFSERHKTIHFRANPRLTGGIDLTWTPYEGFPVTHYEIYRGSDRYALAQIGLSNPDILSKSDPDPPDGLIYYQVAAVPQEPCFPTIGKKKVVPTPFTSSRSNIDDNRETSFFEKNSPRKDYIEIYPNPFNQSATIRFDNPSGESYTLFITDLSGKIFRIVNNISTSEILLEREDLKQGFYFLELRGPSIYRGKIVIE